MRKKTVILSCAMLVALAIGCKKDISDEEFCASCFVKTVMTMGDSGVEPITNETTVEECGLSQANYDEFLRGGNVTSTTTTDGVTMTIKMTTTCTRK